MVESAQDAIFFKDLDSRYVVVNDATLEAFGLRGEEVIGRNDLEIMPSREEAEKNIHDDQLVFKRGRPSQITKHMTGTGGEEHWFQATKTPRFDGEGNVIGLIGIGRDITEYKRAEEALREAEKKFRRMSASAYDAIIMIDDEGKVTYWNEAAEKMFGYSSQEIMGRELHATLAPQRYWEAYGTGITKFKVMGQGAAVGKTTELAGLTKDGIEFPIELSMSAVKIKGKWNAIGIVRDITERKKAEERERELQQELILAGRLASIGRMASGIAHEINNPLTGVAGFSDLLLKRDIPEDIRGSLKIIYDGAQRVAGITSRLLTFAHKSKPERTYVNINDIIESTLALRAYEMRNSNIEATTQLDSDLQLTMADAAQVQQVFLNIVLNAETEMTRAHGKGNLLVKTERMDNAIRISFKDDGPGIPKENLDKIFEPFFTTREVGQGTGLGLSVSHGIVTGHGGRIYAQSELGKGATFFVELATVTEAAQLKPVEPPAGEPKKEPGGRILVVDDEPLVQQLLTKMLSEEGHEVDIVDNGDAAVEKLQSEDYDVVLVDAKLPGMSGTEVYEHLQREAKPLVSRVVFITGDVMSEDTMAFLTRTKARYIAKPFDTERLRKDIKSMLTQRR